MILAGKDVQIPLARMPKISVITPSYNQVNFIQFTIDSVLKQEYPNLEYMIIDGGSTDGTVEVLRQYSDRLRWVSEKDKGQSDAINKGFKIATGDVLAVLNSDDIYEPGTLAKVGGFFARHPEAKWVTGKCYTIDRSGRATRPLITLYKNFWLHMNFSHALFVLNFISQPATFWRRELTQQIGGFNESLFYTMDYEYWLRISKVARLFILHSYLASFRYYPDSKSGSTTGAQFEEQYRVARESTSSTALLKIHRLHNLITVFFYRRSSISTGNSHL
jgi:glycosyltransferase involved in cell wall biosynthesis